jgi:hypothetical protein
LLVALLWAPLARAQTAAPGTKAEAPDADVSPAAEEAVFPPPGARVGVTLGGLGAFVVFYGGAAGMSFAFPDVPGATDLRIPVVGPWLSIAHNGCAPNEVDCSDEWVALRSVITALDGVAQAGSLAIALEGLFLPTQEVAHAPANGPSQRPAAPKRPPPEQPTSPPPKNLFWVPMPMAVGQRGIGAGVVGRF